MAVYALVAIKLAQSATPVALAGDQFIMAKISIWGPSIYIGLAAAASSSALGSIMVAPRTLQALARDDVFPVSKVNKLLAGGRGDAQEPVNATFVSVLFAAVFVALGDIDFIAQILSMFFMVTYGALCTVSFLEYFAGNPSYRPTFRSRWYLSLIGALMCVFMMIKMNTLYAILAIVIMVMAIRISVSAIAIVARKSGGNLTSTTLVANLVKLLLLIMGAALVLQIPGVEITTLVTALGISGLAVALALQDTLGNLFAGMQIIMSRQINPGDYVALASGEEGHVTDVQARNTTIRTFPECNRVLVPNGILASTVVTNYSLPHKRLLIRLPVGVAYDSDLEEVEGVTLAVAREVLDEVEGGLTDEDPFVRFDEFSDFSINCLLRVPVREFKDQFKIRHMLVKRLHQRYAAEGIEIPFPIRTVYMRDRTAAT